jgi:hypothetical protein
MVFIIITSDISSTKVIREGKPTHGHWCKMFHNQIFSQVENDIYLLQVYKTTSSINCCCATLNFL